MGGFDGTECDFTALDRVVYTVLICGVGICALGYWFFFLRNKTTIV